MAGTLEVQTIQGPASGSNANKIIVPSGHKLHAAGHVLQVVSTTKTDTFSTNTGMNNPALITGLTATITPSASSSKILVMYNVDFGFNAVATTVGVVLDRSGSHISVGDAAGIRPRVTTLNHHEGSNWNSHNAAGSFLDSPNTTSAITYGLKIGNNGNTGVIIYVNRTGRDVNLSSEDGRSTSTITLMEIAQ